MENRFSGFCILTDDVLRLRDFYQRVLEADADGDEVHSFVHLCALSFAIYNPAKHEDSRIAALDFGSGSVILEFEVADVDREHRRLKEELNAPIIAPPTTHPWERRAMQFVDPDGNMVTFYHRVDAAK